VSFDGSFYERPASLNDIPAFEDLLDVNILVISAKLGNKFVRITDNTHRKNLYLYLVDDHYHAIANISGFFLSHYFCESCLQPYDHNHRHFCATTCIVCKRDGCLETDTPLSCRRCHMTCRSLECFNRHKQNTVSKGKNRRRSPSQCDTWWKCTTCRKTLHVEDRTPEDHLCGEYKCQSCARYVLNDHQCYVRATPIEEEHIPKFIFFYFECTQDDVLQCEEGYLTHKIPSCQQCKEGSPCKSCTLCQNCTNSWCGKMEHRPNLLVAHTVCPKCIAKELTPKYKCKSCGTRCETCGDEEYEGPPCKDTCGFREVVFKGNDTADQFGA